MTDDEKTCERDGCEVVFRREKRKSRARFAARRFCSTSCSAKAGNAARELDPDRLCGAGLHRMGDSTKCAQCHRDRNRGRRRKPVAAPRPRRRPAPAPVQTERSVEPAPTWRPAGWGPVRA